MNPRQLLAELRRRPLLIIGGLVGLFAIANLGDLFGRGQAPADGTDPAADPNADPATDPTAADQGYATPSYAYSAPSYDPFGTDLGSYTPTTQYSPEGCPLPRPDAPALYAGQGEYKCDAASHQWVWTWNPAKVSKGGCLLPKPKVPAAYTGKGDYVCDAASKTWVWKWKPSNPPKATPGRLVLAAGTHQTFSVTSKRATDPRTWQHGAATVGTSGKQAVRLPSGQTVDMVRITTGGHAGRWIRTTAGTWTAPTGG